MMDLERLKLLIADMFARMDKVERMGAGIQRIRDEMKRAELPQLEIESNTFFKITFSRLHKLGEVVRNLQLNRLSS